MNGPEDVRRKAEEIRSSLAELQSGDDPARQLAEDMLRHIALNEIQRNPPEGASHVTRDSALRLFVSDSGPGIADTLANNPNSRSRAQTTKLSSSPRKRAYPRTATRTGATVSTTSWSRQGSRATHLVIHSRKVFLIKFQDGTFQSIKASEYSGTIIVPTVPL